MCEYGQSAHDENQMKKEIHICSWAPFCHLYYDINMSRIQYTIAQNPSPTSVNSSLNC